MAAHGMSEDTHAIRVHRKSGRDPRRQFPRDVRIHAVTARPRRLRRVEVEAGAETEVIAVALTRNAETSRARIRHHERQPKRSRDPLRARLHDEVLLGAGEPREPIQYRHAARRGLWRKKDAKAHRALCFLRRVRIHALDAAEAKVLRYRLDRCFRHPSLGPWWRGGRSPAKGKPGRDTRPGRSVGATALHPAPDLCAGGHPFLLRRMRGNQIHDRGRKAIVRLEAKLLQP